MVEIKGLEKNGTNSILPGITIDEIEAIIEANSDLVFSEIPLPDNPRMLALLNDPEILAFIDEVTTPKPNEATEDET